MREFIAFPLEVTAERERRSSRRLEWQLRSFTNVTPLSFRFDSKKGLRDFSSRKKLREEKLPNRIIVVKIFFKYLRRNFFQYIYLEKELVNCAIPLG